MVDTASFNSTKGKNEDLEWVKYICYKYNIDYNKIYKDGLCLSDLSNLNKISLNGRKQHNINGYKIESSYIQVKTINPDIIITILNVLKKYLLEKI